MHRRVSIPKSLLNILPDIQTFQISDARRKILLLILLFGIQIREEEKKTLIRSDTRIRYKTDSIKLQMLQKNWRVSIGSRSDLRKIESVFYTNVSHCFFEYSNVWS